MGNIYKLADRLEGLSAFKPDHKQRKDRGLMGKKRIIYDVEPRAGGDWAAQRRGTDRAASVHELIEEAISEARRLAQQGPLGQVVIRNSEGKIQREYTYGEDPPNRKG